MAGRSFTRHSNGIGNRIRAEHINELQSALEEDDARIDLKTDDGQFTAHVDDTDNPHNVTKAQVGLGNVDNTSDADKPISTAQQAALDSKADVEDAVPSGGVYGQVLTVTHSGREWVDPPGIVYPSLLLSPDGSFDRNGPLIPTVDSGVTIVPGRYGNAWRTNGGSVFVPEANYLGVTGTIISRIRLSAEAANFHYSYFSSNSVNGVAVQRRATGQFSLWVGGVEVFRLSSFPVDQHVVTAVTYDQHKASWRVNSDAGVVDIAPASPSLGGTVGARSAGGASHDAEAHLLYPIRIPDAELARISNIPGPWTMQNTAVNMALQSQPPAGSPFLQMYPPNKKIAAGGATLRTAPGPSTQAITTLAAGTDVHDTKQAASVSSVSYSLVVTAFGNAWVPSSTLV